MSPQEVRRALAKSDARLLTRAAFRRETPKGDRTLERLLLEDSFTPAIPEDHTRETSLYMPSIRMWESSVGATFSFRDSRLVFVEVDANPLDANQASAVVSAISDRLGIDHHLRRREESTDVPGAYTLHYDSDSATPSLWVNLTDHDHPVISLRISHPATLAATERKMNDRQQDAFGRD